MMTLNPHEMTDEQLAQVMNQAEQGINNEEQPNLEGTVAAQETSPAAEEQEPEGEFGLLKEEPTPEVTENAEAAGLRLADYTKKTQELAEQRREFETEKQRLAHLETFNQAWERPELRPVILQALAEEAGIPLPGVASPQRAPVQADQGGLIGEYDPSDRENPEWIQRGYASETELVLSKQVAALSGTLQKVEGFLNGQVQEKQMEAQVHQSASQIGQKLGITGVTPERVKEAMLATGLQDPEAAFLKHNIEALMGVAKKSGGQAVATAKPNSPSAGGGRTFNPNDYSKDPDMIMHLMSQGFTPVE